MWYNSEMMMRKKGRNEEVDDKNAFGLQLQATGNAILKQRLFVCYVLSLRCPLTKIDNILLRPTTAVTTVKLTVYN